MNREKLTYDILKELFNISTGRAADLLSEIINRKIILNVPEIEIINMTNNKNKVDDYCPNILDGTLMVSSVALENNLIGKANLIFPAEKMKIFIDLCLNKEEEIKYSEINFTDVDFDIIKEIGNIILSCVIGEIANFLKFNINFTLPEVKVFNKIDFSKDIEKNGYMHMLLLSITFIIDQTEITGAIIIDLTLNSLKELIEKIDMIEGKLYE